MTQRVQARSEYRSQRHFKFSESGAHRRASAGQYPAGRPDRLTAGTRAAAAAATSESAAATQAAAAAAACAAAYAAARPAGGAGRLPSLRNQNSDSSCHTQKLILECQANRPDPEVQDLDAEIIRLQKIEDGKKQGHLPRLG